MEIPTSLLAEGYQGALISALSSELEPLLDPEAKKLVEQLIQAVALQSSSRAHRRLGALLEGMTAEVISRDKLAALLERQSSEASAIDAIYH